MEMNELSDPAVMEDGMVTLGDGLAGYVEAYLAKGREARIVFRNEDQVGAKVHHIYYRDEEKKQ